MQTKPKIHELGIIKWLLTLMLIAIETRKEKVLTEEPLAKVILNGVKNLGWGITSYLVDPLPQTLSEAKGLYPGLQPWAWGFISMPQTSVWGTG